MNRQMSLAQIKNQQPARAMPVLAQERQILSLSEAKHWDARVLGVAPVPATAFYYKEWWIVPLHEDTSRIPPRALERVRLLYAAGISPKAFVIAHEAPRELKPPPETKIVSPLQYWTRRSAQGAGTVLKGAATMAAVVAPVLLTILGTTLLASFALAGALAADPCLIAVTEDDVWIQIDYWMA